MRAMGCAIALDDVGADVDTLAMMGLLAPEVIKLDLALIAGSPRRPTSPRSSTPVAAQAERSGATILVERIETRAPGRARATRSGRGSRRAGCSAAAPAWSPPAPPARPTRRRRAAHSDPRDIAPFALVAGAAHRPRPGRRADDRDEPPPRGAGAARRAAPRCCVSSFGQRQRCHPRAARALRGSWRACRLLRRRRRAACRPSPRPASTAARCTPPIRSARVDRRRGRPALRRRAGRARAARPAPTARTSSTTCSRTTASWPSRRLTARVALSSPRASLRRVRRRVDARLCGPLARPGARSDRWLEIKKVGVLGRGPHGPRDRPGGGDRRLRRGAARGRRRRPLDKGIGKIEKQLARAVEKGKAEQDDADAIRGRIQGTPDYADLADCDLVIEAITENLDLKLEMWREVDAIVKAERALRDQHLLAAGHRPGRGDRARRRVPRPALLQPGAGDEAGRGRARRHDLRRGLRRRRRVRRAAWASSRSPTRDKAGFIVNRLLVPVPARRASAPTRRASARSRRSTRR